MKKVIFLGAVMAASGAAVANEPGQSGYYSGLQAGVANTNLKVNADDIRIDGLNMNGFVGGVFLGTRADISEQAFWGLEANAQINGNRVKISDGNEKATIKNEYGYGAHLLAGIHASESTRIYGKAGYQHSKFKWHDVGSKKIGGFSVGAGGEVAVSNEFSLRLDWTQTHYSRKYGMKPTDTVVQAGVVYRY